jgi:ATP-dependent Clp protease protease subunit
MNKIGGICYAHQQVDTVHKIYLYDEVKAKGDFNWNTLQYDESETSANHFREMLEQVGENDTIELYINSDGGSVKEGTAIFTNLKRCPAYKTGYVDGVANSIAATILQACDHRVMGEGTGMVLHNMWTVAVGNADEIRNEADKLDAWMKASRALFMQRCQGKITEDELKEIMDKETLLGPDDALEIGVIDEIAGRTSVEIEEAMQSTKGIKEMKDKIKQSGFSDQLKEFEELVADSEEKEEDEVSMATFLNMFSL